MEPFSANINLNTTSLNFAQCLRDVHNWGDTVYMNICSGAQATVPWGTVDYFVHGIGAVLFGMLLLMFIAVPITIAMDR